MTPTVLIEDSVYKKVMHWVNKSAYEVSGLGTLKVESDGTLRVISAMLLPQENGATHTDIEAEEMNRAMFELRNSEGMLRWWWHSHVQMGVFWSGTDMDTIRKLGAGGWFLNTVFNQKNEVKTSFYSYDGQKTPWGTEPLFIDDIKTKTMLADDPRIQEWDAEYEKNVKIQTHSRSLYDHANQNWQEDGAWEKMEGVWQKKESSVIDMRQNALAGYDTTVEPPPVRPIGMSKSTYKKWKRSFQEKNGASLSPAMLPKTRPTSTWELDCDRFGLKPEESLLLSQKGWTDSDIDELMDEFSVNEMLRMCVKGMNPEDIYYLLDQCRYDYAEIMNLVEEAERSNEAVSEVMKAVVR